MKHFIIPKNEEPTVVEKALMLMVEKGEAFPRIIHIGGTTITFYKILTF